MVAGYDCEGTVRFVGKHVELGKPRVGVELDQPLGKHKGTVKGHEYFTCKAKHGLLVPQKDVTRVTTRAEAPAAEAPAAESPATDAPAAEDYDGMGRLKLIKCLKGRNVAYSHLGKDVDALRALAKESDPNATAAAPESAPLPPVDDLEVYDNADAAGEAATEVPTEVPAEAPVELEIYDNAEATEVAAPEEEGGELYGASDVVPNVEAKPEPPILTKEERKAQRAEFFKEIDADGDGKIDLNEAMAFGMTESTFQILDVNGDGNLTKKEISKWIQAEIAREVEEEGPELTMEEIQAQLAAAQAAVASQEREDAGEPAPAATEEEGGELYGASDVVPNREEPAPEESGEVYGPTATEPAASGGDDGVDVYGPTITSTPDDAADVGATGFGEAEEVEQYKAWGKAGGKGLDGVKPVELEYTGNTSVIRTKAEQEKATVDAQATVDRLAAEVAAKQEAASAAAEARKLRKEEQAKQATAAADAFVEQTKADTSNRVAQAVAERKEMLLDEMLAGKPATYGAANLAPPQLICGTLRTRNFTSSRPHKDKQYSAEYARFNSSTGWVANDAAAQMYLQIDMDGIMLVTQLLTRGTKGGEFFTPEFTLEYSANGAHFTKFTASGNPDDDAVTLKANASGDDLATVELHRPLATRFLRICPVASGATPGMRVDIYARPVGEPIGLADGTFKDAMITTSSDKVPIMSGSACRLPTARAVASNSAWQPGAKDLEPWIAFKFAKESLHLVTAVAIQGRETKVGQWVTEFQVGILDGLHGDTYEMYADDSGAAVTFGGNSDQHAVVVVTFDKPLIACQVRIFPKKWANGCAMRCEVYANPVGYYSGVESGKIPDSALTSSGQFTPKCGPTSGRLNGGGTEGGWAGLRGPQTATSARAAIVDSSTKGHTGDEENPHHVVELVAAVAAGANQEWFQVDLGDIMCVPAVVIQGKAGKFDQHVKAFKLVVSVDGIVFHPCTSDAGSEIFVGNSDQNTPMVRQVAPAAIARYVRFIPTDWHRRVAMRCEVISKSYGEALGLGWGGAVADECFLKTEVEPTETSNPSNARLENSEAWSPTTSDMSQFIEVDLQREHHINAVLMQGSPDSEDHVTAFRLEMSKDNKVWWAHSEDGYVKVFPGNTEKYHIASPLETAENRFFKKQETVRNEWNGLMGCHLRAYAVARYVRICPMKWNNAIAMRVEILGKPAELIKRDTKTLKSLFAEVEDDAFGQAEDEEDEEDFSSPWGALHGDMKGEGSVNSLNENGDINFLHARQQRRTSVSYGFEDGEAFGFDGA
jgi:hypothetical protein